MTRATMTIYDDLYPDEMRELVECEVDTFNVSQSVDELGVALPVQRRELRIETDLDLRSVDWEALDRASQAFTSAVSEVVDALGGSLSVLSAVQADAAARAAREIAQQFTYSIDLDSSHVAIAQASGDMRGSTEILRDLRKSERDYEKARRRSIRNSQQERRPRRASLGGRGGYKHVYR